VGKRNKSTEAAIEALLASLDIEIEGPLKNTPKLVADLWRKHLLAGTGIPLARVLGKGMTSRARQPVILADVDIHLVCPHHLTIAFGRAHLSYQPQGRIVGFGALTRLVEVCTAQLILQEDATTRIVEAIVEHLGAEAAVARLEATHPCHNVTRPKAHRSRIITWAEAGNQKRAAALTRQLRSEIDNTKRELSRRPRGRTR